MSEQTVLDETQVPAVMPVIEPAVEMPAVVSDVVGSAVMPAAAMAVDPKVRLESAQDEAKAARAAFLASLPVATAGQVLSVVIACREVQCAIADVEVASGLNQKFRLTEEQKDQVAAAKAEHRVIINEAAVKVEASEHVRTAYLRSYKLRVRKDGRVMLSVSGLL